MAASFHLHCWGSRLIHNSMTAPKFFVGAFAHQRTSALQLYGVFSQRRVGDAFYPNLGNRVIIRGAVLVPKRRWGFRHFFVPRSSFAAQFWLLKSVGVLVRKNCGTHITYILNSQICASRIPTFFGTKTIPQNWNADPQNLKKRDTQKRMRKLPQQIKNASINLIAETHQVWYSSCARRHETHAPIRADVNPRSAPRVRVHVHMSIREYTNAAHEAVWFICARIATRGATTAGASQR